MRLAAAGIVSTAMLLVPGCERPSAPKREAADPVRRATYRSFVARDFLGSCAAVRGWRTAQAERHFDELRQFALRKGLGRSLWLGENDWNAVSRVAERRRCSTADKEYDAALAAFDGALDQLATAIAGHREE